MPTPTADTYTAASGATLQGGRGTPAGPSTTPLAAFQIAADGIWTWFTDPRAIYRNGATYVMSVDSAGTCRVYKYTHATAVTTSFQLSATALEADDHDNGSLYFREDGRIVAFYGIHNDGALRYRVSNAAEDITAWGTEAVRGTGDTYSYPSMLRWSQDTSKSYIFYRRWNGSGERRLGFRTFTGAVTGVADTISANTDVWLSTGHIPYWKLTPDAVNKLHVLTTDMHPVEGQSSLYHFYLQLDGSNVLRKYQSDGTEIVAALPIGPANATLIYDGSGTKCWVSDSIIDSTGKPRVLYMRYPGNTGAAIEYWHARWTGSAWVSSKVTDDGAGLFSPEVYYHGGLCFDSMDPTKVFLSAPVSGVRQIQEWSTVNEGVTWAKVRDLTTGGTAGAPLRGRPYSPRDHNGSLRVVWWSGRYTSYADYNTSIQGAG